MLIQALKLYFDINILAILILKMLFFYRIKPSLSADANRSPNMAPIIEEAHAMDNEATTKPEGINGDDIPEISLEVPVEPEDKQGEIADVLDVAAEFGDLGVTSYEGSQTNKAPGSEDILAEINEIKRMIAEETDGGTQKAFLFSKK